MINLDTLRARIAEMEGRDMRYAPAPVRVRWNFDLEMMRELLALREREGTNAG